MRVQKNIKLCKQMLRSDVRNDCYHSLQNYFAFLSAVLQLKHQNLQNYDFYLLVFLWV